MLDAFRVVFQGCTNHYSNYCTRSPIIENNQSFLQIQRELSFFMSCHFDFQTKSWKSGWFTIPKNQWLKYPNTTDYQNPILGISGRYLKGGLV